VGVLVVLVALVALVTGLGLGALLARRAAAPTEGLKHLAAQLRETHETLERTRASEATAKAVFEASPVAMAVFDIRHADLDKVDGDRPPALMDTNRAWERVTGHSPEFTRGKTSAELGLWADPEDRQRLASRVQRDGAVQGFQARLLRADGEPFEASLSIHRADVGQVSIAIFAVVDVTAEREAHLQLHSLNKRLLSVQAELMDLNTSLDLRVRDRTREVERSVAELQAALDDLRRTQDQLVQSEKLAGLGTIVARVAHEMNTPLGVAVTAGSTLQDHVRIMQARVDEGRLRRTELDHFMGNLRSGLSMVMGGLDRAHRLVTTFKQVASDHNNENRRRFDLYQCIDATSTLLETTLRNTPHKLEIDIPPGIEMDSYPGAIEQLFINLFNNALLHAFEGRDSGVLRFSASIKGQHITFVFEDNGIGMPEAVRRRIFDPFFTTKAGAGGSGLGLTICFNLVTSTLGGEIEVQSQEGEGTRFVIRMPRVAPPLQSRSGAETHS
jgi:PAS domain S-box-containing protein